MNENSELKKLRNENEKLREALAQLLEIIKKFDVFRDENSIFISDILGTQSELSKEKSIKKLLEKYSDLK